ncbi:MAG: DUF4055 domain-containing protein [Limnohabitans sp.]
MGGLTGQPVTLTESSTASEDPSARNGATLGMMQFWQPINICIGGTGAIRQYSESIIPREPKEDDDAYNRRIFHAVLPPFLQRLAAQAAGTILRKGIHLEGGDQEFWDEWSKDVTGDGTPLNEFARRLLVDALLYGHTSMLVDYPAGDQPLSLADELKSRRMPYLTLVSAQAIRGWRTDGNRQQSRLTQVRYIEHVSEPDGRFGEVIHEQVRVLEEGRWEVWRNEQPGWRKIDGGETSLDEVPLVAVYSNRMGTLMSRPPLLEVANLNISYCQRFTDYHHSIHVGALPVLVLKGFDPDGNNDLGLSTNTAILLPPDGDAFLVEPTSNAYDSQLKCLQTLEEQITSLGISTLAKQNLTNAAAEAKRLDRIDTDSIMSIISEDLARAMGDMLRIAGKYAGKEPPEVTIPKDYENRLLDGNQITAMLQLQMQNQISQKTLLRILYEGEVLPPYIDIDEEILQTKDEMEEKMDMQLEQAEAQMEMAAEHAPPPAAGGGAGGATSGKAAKGGSKGSQTLPTPMRPGKHAG